MSCSRRHFLASLPVFGSAALAPRALAGAAALRSADLATDLDELAGRILATDRGEVFGLAAEALANGATWRDLLGAVLLAGVREVRPRPVGYKLHAVMMVSSAYQVAEAMPGRDRLLPMLFNLDDLKSAQAQDERQGGWRLPPADPIEARDREVLARTFEKAMEQWDDEGADRAVTALHERLSLDKAFGLLWPMGARDYRNIGHKAIYTTQAYRALQQVGWRHGQDVVRSLVNALLHGGDGDTASDFAPNLERAAEVAGATGKPDPAASGRLLGRLRECDPQEAAAAVVEHLGEGVAAESLWDGLRLCAFELLWRDPNILSVHPVTTVNAFHKASLVARSDATRALLLLQAASFLPRFREDLARRTGGGEGELDALQPAGEATDAARLFERMAEDRSAAMAEALALVRARGPDTLFEQARHWLVRKAREHHDYKLAAAAEEEVKAAHPRWQPYLAAASLSYLRHPGERDGDVFRRAADLVGD